MSVRSGNRGAICEKPSGIGFNTFQSFTDRQLFTCDSLLISADGWYGVFRVEGRWLGLTIFFHEAGMNFAIIELMDEDACYGFLLDLRHPDSLVYPR